MNTCPYCDAENIEGADVCEQCGQPLDDMYLPDELTAVEDSLLRDRVNNLSPKSPITASVDDTVGDVLTLMVDRGIGCVFIVDGQKLVGVFSERDALLRLNTQAAELSNRPISDFMTRSPQSIVADAKVAFAVRMMDLGGYRHAPIVDEEGNLIGVISVRDILRYLTEKMAASV